MIDILNLDSLEVLARERLEPSAVRLHRRRRRRRVDASRESSGVVANTDCSPGCCAASASGAQKPRCSERRVSFPALVAPMGFHGLCHLDAEEATARATAAEETIFCASTVSNRSLEAIAQASGNGARVVSALRVSRSRDDARARRARGRRRLQRAVPHRRHAARGAPRARPTELAPHARRISKLGNFPASHTAHHHHGAGKGSALAQYIAAHVGSGTHVGGRRVAAVDLAAAGDRQRHSRAEGRGAGDRTWRGRGHRLQPWRTPTRLGAGADHDASARSSTRSRDERKC